MPERQMRDKPFRPVGGVNERGDCARPVAADCPGQLSRMSYC